MRITINPRTLKIMITVIMMLSNSTIWAGIYNPSNFASSGSLAVGSGSIAINTGTAWTDGSVPSITVGQQTYYGTWDRQSAVINNETFQADAAVFCFDDISIGQNISISVSGTRPLVLLSKGNITLNSNLNMGSVGVSNYGTGATHTGPNNHDAGTGGGYASSGQWLFSSSYGWLKSAGRSYGEQTLSSVLLGGSSGGYSYFGGWFASGKGGGAVELVAADSLSLNASILVNGSTGSGGGAGSGGAVLLKGDTVSFGTNGKVEALGGLGSGGTSGSAGRVAIYYGTMNGFDTSDVSIYSRPGASPWNSWSPSGDGSGTLYMEVIPEPATMMLLGLGGMMMRKVKHKS